MVPGPASQGSITCRSSAVGSLPVTLYQPKAFSKSAVPRLTTVKVSEQVGLKVSGSVAASARGSRPSLWLGMHVLSLNTWYIRLSQVPFMPSSQEPSLSQTAPMLQTPGSSQTQAKVGKSPVGSPPSQPGSVGISVPSGCVTCAATDVAQSAPSATAKATRPKCIQDTERLYPRPGPAVHRLRWTRGRRKITPTIGEFRSPRVAPGHGRAFHGLGPSGTIAAEWGRAQGATEREGPTRP